MWRNTSSNFFILFAIHSIRHSKGIKWWKNGDLKSIIYYFMAYLFSRGFSSDDMDDARELELYYSLKFTFTSANHEFLENIFYFLNKWYKLRYNGSMTRPCENVVFFFSPERPPSWQKKCKEEKYEIEYMRDESVSTPLSPFFLVPSNQKKHFDKTNVEEASKWRKKYGNTARKRRRFLCALLIGQQAHD